MSSLRRGYILSILVARNTAAAEFLLGNCFIGTPHKKKKKRPREHAHVKIVDYFYLANSSL